MGYKPGRLLALVGCAALFAVTHMVVQRWSQQQVRYERVASAGCELQSGPCRQMVGGSLVVFAIFPQRIPLMEPLRLRFEAGGLAPRGIVVEVRGLNMNMGLNRTRLAQAADGLWEGQTILPVCSQRYMQWEAIVRIDGQRPIELVFPFVTARP